MPAKKKAPKKSAPKVPAPKIAAQKSGPLDMARTAALKELKSTPAGAAKTGGKRPAAPPAKAQKPAKPPKVPTAKRVGALDAAAQVIASTKKPMRAAEMIEQMAANGLWKSPGGKTPEATLYAAIIREIAAKRKDARFAKHDRGLFVAGNKA